MNRRNQHTIAKALCLFTLAVILSGTVFGCAYKYKGSGLRIGFEYSGRLQDTMCAIASEKKVFDADTVVLAVHFALAVLETDTNANGDTIVGYGLYFGDESMRYDTITNPAYIDYTTVEWGVFLKEISVSETQTGQYGFTQTYRNGKIFAHKEDFCVPAALFSAPSGDIAFQVAVIWRAEERTDYRLSPEGGVTFHYEFISDHEVKLSAA
ncbi:MAG: hypothetical protein LBM78_03715 [Clostridiales bacterium]|jgi:hypothetical protein|nr:hypothetical protein [Clostridiales bacterium]